VAEQAKGEADGAVHLGVMQKKGARAEGVDVTGLGHRRGELVEERHNSKEVLFPSCSQYVERMAAER